MVFLARPRRAAEAAAPPTPALHLRGGFDAGFCVRGEARDSASGTAAAAPAAVQAARRAPAFASLSRALFQLAAAPAPTKCVARSAATAQPYLHSCCSVLTSPRPIAARRDAAQAQHYNVVKVRGDGRCMFRALVRPLVVALVLSHA